MKPSLLASLGIIALASSCAHAPKHDSAMARTLAAASFTEATPKEAASEITGSSEPFKGPYAELARAVTEPVLAKQIRNLLAELSRDESNPEIRVQLGELLIDGGHANLAIAPLRDAFYLRPGRAGIAALLTRAYVDSKKDEEALRLARRLVAERPDEAGRWLFFAEVQRRVGDPQKALEAASRALLIDPHADEAKAVLGFIYAERGQTPLARKLLTEVLGKPGIDAAALEHRLGRIDMEEEQWQPALDHLNASLRENPALAAALNDRGVVYARVGRWAEAKEDFAAAIRISPELAEAQVNFANMKIEEGVRTDAAAALASAKREGTDPGAFYIAAGRLYALDASTSSGRANALLYLRRAKEHVPAATREALDRAVAKIESLPEPKAEAPVAPRQPAVPKPAPAPRSPVQKEGSTARPQPAANVLPVPATPVRSEPGKSPAEPDHADMFRPSVD